MFELELLSNVIIVMIAIWLFFSGVTGDWPWHNDIIVHKHYHNTKKKTDEDEEEEDTE